MTSAPPYLIPGTSVPLLPGTWGVSHGSGWLGSAIRTAELKMSASERFRNGDKDASWAGHAFMYAGFHTLTVGGAPAPVIVEAEWPKVKMSPVTAHADAIWATGQPLSAEQRREAEADALGLLGRHYDPFVYGWFLAKAGGMAVTRDLGPLFRDPHMTICSGCVAHVERRIGVDTAALSLAATSDPQTIAPADLLRWGLNAGTTLTRTDLGWMHKAVPSW